jgi:multicomponent Na+:H+ antiporter subunit D
MKHLPILSIIVLFLGAFLTAIFGSKNKVIRIIIVTAATLLSFIFIMLLIKPILMEGNIITYWMGDWVPEFDWAVGIGLEIDGLNLLFGIIVSIVTLFSGIYSYKYMDKDDGLDKYYVLFLMLSGSVLGLIFTGDLFNMFVMIQIMTFASVGLTAFRNRTEGALEAAFKFIVIGSLGSSLILLGTILLYTQFHTLNMAQLAAMLHNNYTPVTLFAFASLIGGFAVNSCLVPSHVIAPDAYQTSPSSVSMLFSGMVNKAGVYGIIRIIFLIYTSMNLAPMRLMFVFWGTVTMLVGVIMALGQKDIKRLLAFHSISQLGYVFIGIGLSSALGLTGGLYHALNHTLFIGLLFLCAGAVIYVTGTADLNRLGGLIKKMPQTALIFIIGVFSISGLPPFNGFVSKWLIFKGTYEAGYAPVTIIAILASVLTLVSFIKVAYSIFFGQLSNQYENIGETSLSMRMPMWIMALLCFITGVMPQYITKYLITPAVLAVSNVGKYIDAMMGTGYGEKWFGEPLAVLNLNQTISGYYDPMSWLIIFVVALIAFTLLALLGGLSHKQASPEDFKNEGDKVPLRRNLNFKHYFILMDKVNSGVVNDYALLVISTTAIILVYLFLFV